MRCQNCYLRTVTGFGTEDGSQQLSVIGLNNGKLAWRKRDDDIESNTNMNNSSKRIYVMYATDFVFVRLTGEFKFQNNATMGRRRGAVGAHRNALLFGDYVEEVVALAERCGARGTWWIVPNGVERRGGRHNTLFKFKKQLQYLSLKVVFA